MQFVHLPFLCKSGVSWLDSRCCVGSCDHPISTNAHRALPANPYDAFPASGAYNFAVLFQRLLRWYAHLSSDLFRNLTGHGGHTVE